MREDAPSVADFESFKKLTANLAEPELGLASTWAFVDVWRLGSPTRRKRVAVVAISTEALQNNELETPLPGDDRVEAPQQPPNAASALLPPHAAPDELRILKRRFPATIAWRRHNSHRTQHRRCCHRTPPRMNCASTPNSTVRSFVSYSQN